MRVVVRYADVWKTSTGTPEEIRTRLATARLSYGLYSEFLISPRGGDLSQAAKAAADLLPRLR